MDPLIGELKGHGVIGRYFHEGRGLTVAERCTTATVVVWVIWICTWLILDVDVNEWWFAVLMGPLTVAAEYPSLKVIDDNAMMELVPLAAALLFRPLFSTN